MNAFRLKLRLWGVRGSVPTPCAKNLGYGGNTPCVEVRLPGGDVLIFDAGTGIRQLGFDLLKQPPPEGKIHIFLTHYHWDHIHGLPFFGPLFDTMRISFYTGGKLETLEQAMAGQMKNPYFPIDFETLASRHEYLDLGGGEFKNGEVSVRAFPVHHPQGACGFRVDAGDASIIYVPDREPGNAELDRVVRECSEGAGILIHDAQYTPEEYGRFKGWGHSTWEEAVQVARDSNVKELVLFHHDPEHDDNQISRIEKDASQRLETTRAAVEGWMVEL